MARIIHISDLHMMASPPKLRGSLEDLAQKEISALKPDFVVASGDITLGGEPPQFERARAFLSSISGSKLVVPGNTDCDHNPSIDAFFPNEDAAGVSQPPVSNGSGVSGAGSSSSNLSFANLRYLSGEEAKKVSVENLFEPLFPVRIGEEHYFVAKPHSIFSNAVPENLLSESVLYAYNPIKTFSSFFQDMTKPIVSGNLRIAGIDSNHPIPLEEPIISLELSGKQVYLFKKFDGSFSDAQKTGFLGFMEKNGKSSPGKAVVKVAVIHHPIVRSPFSTYFGDFHNAKECLKLISGAGVQLVLSGHKHTPYVAVVPPWNGNVPATAHITANSLFSDDLKAPYATNSFYIIDISGSDAKITMKELGHPLEKANAISVRLA